VKPLKGKVAIVTGASKGMGRHFVAALIGAGAQVSALARASEALSKLEAEAGQDMLVQACDVSDPAQVDHAIARTVERFGRLDFLINNAAIYSPFLLEKATNAEVDQHFAVNVSGPIWATRAAIPHLRASGGQIVFLSSESVRNPFPMLSVYAATKAAIETLAAGLRDELRADGIRVTILRSGSVSGSSGGDHWSDEVRQAFFKKIVETGHANTAGEAATPESMAKALIAALTLPPDVNADLFEVRAARAGVPAGAEDYQ
jgi:NADP-dependent 3-hydroxy acid dehydrogenase YdfG